MRIRSFRDRTRRSQDLLLWPMPDLIQARSAELASCAKQHGYWSLEPRDRNELSNRSNRLKLEFVSLGKLVNRHHSGPIYPVK